MRHDRSTENRARGLTALYPKTWRARYGEEFTQLLVDDLHDRPRSVRRDLDVMAHALWTRLTYRGLAGDAVDVVRRQRAALGVVAPVVAVSVLLGMGVWSQLSIGWQWSAPADPATRVAMWLMSGALVGLAALALMATALLAGAVVIRLIRGDAPGLWRPATVALVAGTVLYLGCRHFGAGWPGTGGHPWAGRDLVPAWAARFVWAGTLWVSSYWAHPDAMRAFPVSELVWMVVSPVAWLVLLVAGRKTVHRLGMTRRVQRYMVVTAAGAVALMGVCLAGAGSWVLSGGPGPRDLFAVGVIDLAIVGTLAAALMIATHFLRRAGTGRTRRISG